MSTEPVKVGYVVVIVDDSMTRNLWPKGKVTCVHPGKDGVVRAVDVETSCGVYRRSVTKLCVLDVFKK